LWPRPCPHREPTLGVAKLDPTLKPALRNRPNERARRTWLFQADARRFDIDGFFATRPAECLWLVSRYAEQIGLGDRVFVWRSVGGGSEAESGVIAEAQVASAVMSMTDDPTSRPFWHTPDDAVASKNRVWLRLVRIAGKREVVRRVWVKEDPVLHDLGVLRMAMGTNYAVPPHHAARLSALWSRTGEDWSYAEAIAGLWAYHRTYGQEVSRLAGSPVAEVAVTIGRAVTGVYSKVMNYRAIDPRAAGTGLSGASATDRKAWARFYDATARELRAELLEWEYKRLWSPLEGDRLAEGPDTSEADFAREVEHLASLSLPDLLAHLRADPDRPQLGPTAVCMRTRRFERDPIVAAIAKVRAGFRCEIPACPHPTFEAEDGQFYMEVHHIEPLAEGGADTAENVACICPAHHREAHYGRRADAIRAVLLKLRAAEAELWPELGDG
jgi:HNH endonuclease/EVE domain